MSKRLLFSLAAGAFALSVAACAAIASPINPGVYIGSGDAGSLTVLARSGGGGGHGGGYGGGGGGHGGGGFYGGGFGGGVHGAHFAGRSTFAGHSLVQAHLANGRHFQNGHGHGHHHRHRFFIGGYPYSYYDDGFYDDDDDNCLWSRRYHRWVCPDY